MTLNLELALKYNLQRGSPFLDTAIVAARNCEEELVV